MDGSRVLVRANFVRDWTTHENFPKFTLQTIMKVHTSDSMIWPTGSSWGILPIEEAGDWAPCDGTLRHFAPKRAALVLRPEDSLTYKKVKLQGQVILSLGDEPA